MRRDLERSWREAAREAGCTGADATLDAVGSDLLLRWSQPHRRYHDLRHLTEALDAVDVLAAEAGDPAAVRLAVWFHDAVYAGRPGSDEEDSARLAEQVLMALDLPRERIAGVARLVRLTARHDVAPGDADAAVLCDADLAVLGAPADRYAEYVRDVRAEYAHVPAETFRSGRAAVLRRLAARSPLFRTRTGHALWEVAAGTNLATELALLAPPGTTPDGG